MNTAVFVISTGRCGTQWLAGFLGINLGSSACVTHEPLHSDYQPRLMLAAKTPANLPDAELREPVEEHVAWIAGVVRGKTYIECGHPCWSSLPFLLETFQPNVRVIHLVRHPVPTAWSWLTQQAFSRPLAPHLTEKILLSPFDEGVQFPRYRERWETMTPYEKALYYWLEVNAFALQVRSETATPWLTVRYEDLFSTTAQARLLSFAGFHIDAPVVPGLVDDSHNVTVNDVDPFQVEHHPDVMRLAEVFGYDPLRIDVRPLEMRYKAFALKRPAG